MISYDLLMKISYYVVDDEYKHNIISKDTYINKFIK